ncbi:MAG: ribonuclease HI family protein [Thermoleophilia bacterium]|nr:ribonuclease HI family protein [Thermoleophilia bacterium]
MPGRRICGGRRRPSTTRTSFRSLRASSSTFPRDLRVRVRLFTDGGARGNPGPAAAAFVLELEDGTVLDARGDAIGIQTNNVAEYIALLNGLRRATELGVTEIEVVSDSELMVKQMRGEYKIKNAALRELSIEAARLARAVGSVRYTAVRREHNVLADRLVNDALDAAP